MRSDLIAKFIKKQNEIYFLVAWILMEIKICVANSSLPDVNLKIISYICILLFILKILTSKYTFKERNIIFLLLILGSFITFICHDSRVLWLSLVLSSLKGIELDKIIKTSFITMSFCVIIFFVLFMLGFTSGIYNDYVKGIRFGFGMGHPNMFSMYYNLLLAHLICLKFNTIRHSKIAFSLCIEVIVFILSKSVTGLIIYFLIIVLFYVYNDDYFSNLRIKEKIKDIFPIVVIFCIILFSLFPLIYSNNTFFRKIDTMFTGRFSQANFYYEKYGISLFGNDISQDLQSKWSNAVLDNGYARMLICNGIIYYLSVTISSIILMFHLKKKKEYSLLLFVITLTVYMFTENVTTYVFMNVSMLYFSIFIYARGGQHYVIEKKNS